MIQQKTLASALLVDQCETKLLHIERHRDGRVPDSKHCLLPGKVVNVFAAHSLWQEFDLIDLPSRSLQSIIHMVNCKRRQDMERVNRRTRYR